MKRSRLDFPSSGWDLSLGQRIASIPATVQMDTTPAESALAHSPLRAVENVLAGLREDTDLPALVERVQRHQLRCVVVLASSVAAWQSRDAVGWARVSAWLAAQGVPVVQIELRPGPTTEEPGRAG